jgi:hypothetical protein
MLDDRHFEKAMKCTSPGAAIERLRRAGLLAKAGSGPTAVDDPLFAEYLQDRSLDQLK